MTEQTENPILMPLTDFLDRLESIEGMEDPFKSIIRCYDGDDPTIRLYHGERPVATTNREEARANPNIAFLNDVGYWMLRAIKQHGSPLSVQEAEQLGEWRFSSAYPYIEGSTKRLVKVGVATQEGEYVYSQEQRYPRFGLGDLSQFSVSYRPPASQDSEFMGITTQTMNRQREQLS